MILSEPLINQLARRLNMPRAEIQRELSILARLIREQTKRDGRVRVPHLGIFENKEDSLRFEPIETLAHAVNYRYRGLETITVSSSEEAVVTADIFEQQPTEDPSEAVAETTETNVFEVDESATDPADDKLWKVDLSETEAVEVDLLDPDPIGAAPAGAPMADAAVPKAAPRTIPDLPPTPAHTVKPVPEKRRKLMPVLFALLFLLAAATAVFYLVYDGDMLQVKQALRGDDLPNQVGASEIQPLQPGPQVTDSAPTEDSLAAETIPPADTSENWTIVAASETDSTVANRIADNLRQALDTSELPVSVLAAEAEAGLRYRVSLGRYASESEADSAIARLGTILPADAWTLDLAENNE